MALDIDNPRFYQRKIDEFINLCENDLITLVEKEFNNLYIANDKPYITLMFNIGKPIVAELTVMNDKLHYKYALSGKDEYICKSSNWTPLPREEILNVYSKLYFKHYEN